MAQVTLRQLITDVATTIGTVGIVHASQRLDTLKEGMNDRAVTQTYFDTLELSHRSQAADRFTFGAGSRPKNPTFRIDVYAKQRGHLGEDNAMVIDIVDAIINKLEEQDESPYFGNQHIKAWHASVQHVTFRYGDPEISYAGSRFTLTLEIF